MISASLVKQLRDLTGAGMMDAKKALVETNGDIEKATEYLREKGILTASKKSTRIAAEGLVASFVSEDGKIGALVEVNSETDFVAKNEKFVNFVKDLAKLVAEKNPKNVEELKNLPYEGKTVVEYLTELISTIGENMNIRRFERIETQGNIVSYIHANGTIGVLVEISEGSKEAAENVALQITAMRPKYLTRDEIPAEVIEKEKNILLEQIKQEGKPEEMAKRIVEGRISKFLYEEVSLMDQKYVKENKISIKEYLDQNKTVVTSFVRMEKGEGLEKREDNFAEEVAKQMRGEF